VTFATAGRKLTVLRAELAAYDTYSRPRIDFDKPVSELIALTGGGWNHIQSYLSPEVLLRLDEHRRGPIYFVVTEGNTPKAYQANAAGIDEWFTDNANRMAGVELSTTLAFLERIASQNLTSDDLGEAHRAISVLRRKLGVSMKRETDPL
jgi:hypothetical protein